MHKYTHICTSMHTCICTLYAHIRICTCVHICMVQSHKGPSIYDIHTEGGQAQVDACGRGDQAPCGRPHRKLKLESTDVILSSSHAKKLVSLLTEFHLWTE